MDITQPYDVKGKRVVNLSRVNDLLLQGNDLGLDLLSPNFYEFKTSLLHEDSGA